MGALHYSVPIKAPGQRSKLSLSVVFDQTQAACVCGGVVVKERERQTECMCVCEKDRVRDVYV